MKHRQIKAVQKTGQLVQYIFYDPAVSVIPDAKDTDAVPACIGNVDVGAFFGVETAAHADITDIGAALHNILSDAGCIAEQNGICITDSPDDLIVIFRNIAEENNFPCIQLKRFLGGGNQTDRFNGNQFLKHRKASL